MFHSVVTNAPFIGRVEKGVERSVYITEFAVIRILEIKSSPNIVCEATVCSPLLTVSERYRFIYLGHTQGIVTLLTAHFHQGHDS